MTDRANPIFVALDTASADDAEDLARRVAPHVGGLKLGLELFCAQGPAGIRRLAGLGLPVFLDLKLHDIPNTVSGAVRAATALRPTYITIHAAGGRAMMQAAATAAREASATLGIAAPRLLGVTVLTSLDAGDLAAVGQDADPGAQAGRLAALAEEAGLGGVVCAPQEIARLRRALGPGMLLMVPGIRPRGTAAGDQKRVMTPADAIAAGADLLVVGRPITAAQDPAAAARDIAAEAMAVRAIFTSSADHLLMKP